MRELIAAVQIEASIRLRPQRQGPLTAEKAWLEEWEQPCKWPSTTEPMIRRVHGRLVPNPRRHVANIAAVFARLNETGGVADMFDSPNTQGSPNKMPSRVPASCGSLDHAMCSGESTGLDWQWMPRRLITSTNSYLTNAVPLFERIHSTVNGTP